MSLSNVYSGGNASTLDGSTRSTQTLTFRSVAPTGDDTRTPSELTNTPPGSSTPDSRVPAPATNPLENGTGNSCVPASFFAPVLTASVYGFHASSDAFGVICTVRESLHK
ncbi:MAG: hypothetical protein HC933_02045 [Pleurocapsa sp. SU_196_0]|nr:hypothetical protein [Pleurocapsa sp. SU_196_0]